MPYPPFYGGDALYTSQLIESLAPWVDSVNVVCHAQYGQTPPANTRAHWTPVIKQLRTRHSSLASRWPSIVHRSSTPQLTTRVFELLRSEKWDVVVADNLAVAGIVQSLEAEIVGRTSLVHVSHNHESSLRRDLAAAVPARSPYRYALWLDALKAGRLERWLVKRSELITAISPVDAVRFRSAAPDEDVLTLTPGYSGSVAEARVIDLGVPRRATVLGSFEWIAKQLNLRSFLSAAVDRLAQSGIDLDVVGAIPTRLRDELAAAYPTVRFTGSVQDPSDYLQHSRVGIVPEAVGGGFKLKALDYIFNRVPLFALEGSLSGLPISAPREYSEFDSLGDLAVGVVSAIDDIPLLNALANRAFEACDAKFQWPDRGMILAAALQRINARA